MNSFIEEKVLQDAFWECAHITKRNLAAFKGSFPKAYSEKGYYAPIPNTDWTNGFYSGILWLCYEYTKDEAFKESAMETVESFKERVEKEIALETHDIGFLYSLSCVAAYKLVQDETAKKAALQAADLLIKRYHEKGEFIQAWGPIGGKEHYRLIIDCLLNLPLLYWATEETGEAVYKEVAVKHAYTALRYVIREDDSTYHTFYFDMETGAPKGGATCQGYSDDSAWARGQAWGVYGSILSYKETKDPMFLDDFRRLKTYFMERLPEDSVPYWDLIFTSGDEPRDSSSAAIVCCALDEALKYIKDEQEKQQLIKERDTLLVSLIESYAAKKEDEGNGLLYHGTYSKKSPYNTCTPEGVDAFVIWGDYYYMEALMRVLNPQWKRYW
jgi:unsaturated chondroitin disaccharide hydrolase